MKMLSKLLMIVIMAKELRRGIEFGEFNINSKVLMVQLLDNFMKN